MNKKLFTTFATKTSDMGKTDRHIPWREWLHMPSRWWRAFKVWYKGLYVGRPWYIKILSAIGTLIVSFFLFLLAVDMNFLWLFGKSPSTSKIMHPDTAEASYIYSADGKELGKYFDENRTPVPYDSINPQFFTVLIDTEDERFYSHHGIDYSGFAAAFKDWVIYGRARGASTITQQLVKNMFRTRQEYSTGLLGYIPGVKMLIMKSKEWIIATKLELFYTKREILEMYANTVDFGSNAFGIKTAAKTYFAKTPIELNLEECAVLVGLLKATSTYNPRLNPKNSLRRRNVVLNNMRDLGDLSKAECDSIKRLPIDLHFSIENPNDGEALYFRQAVAVELDGWCKETGHDLYRDGLRIYTTIDTRMQRHAEKAVTERMHQVQRSFDQHWGDSDCWLNEDNQPIPNFVEEKAHNSDAYRNLLARFPNDLDSVNYYMNLPHRVHLFDYENDSLYREMSSMDSIRYMLHFMHTGFIAIEPQTGHIKAWVGDVDFNTWKYDKVTAMHQPGSTFKLFVYAAAMAHGLTPCVRRYDGYIDTVIYDKNKGEMVRWNPANASGRFSNSNITLRAAFAQSVNSVAVKVANEVGIPTVAQTARDLGITSELEESPSLALGSSDVNLLEMAGAYSAVVNDGMAIKPIMVTHILDHNGVEIYRNESRPERALPYRAAFLLQQMLMAGRTDAGGTSQALNTFITGSMTDTDFGGKTGTSDNNADAWYIGVTPKLVCGVWVGGEYRQIHFRSGALGQGSRTALPICGAFFNKVFTDPALKRYHGHFPPVKEWIDPAQYQRCVQEVVPDTATWETDSLDVDSTAIVYDIENEYENETPPDTTKHAN